MDLSPVYQAGPILGGCFALLLVGLLLPARGHLLAKLAALGTLLVLTGTAIYVGLGLACQAWSERPELAWLALVTVSGTIALIAQHRAVRRTRRHDDDDEDDDGGLRVFAPPPPAPVSPGPSRVPDPPPTDWTEFDAIRKGWDRDTVGV